MAVQTRLVAMLWLGAAVTAHGADSGTGTREAKFGEYSDESSVGELARRLTSPLQAARSADERARAGVPAAGHTIDLKDEHFIVHVPPLPASGRYGLLVFVPPWQDARVPAGWDRILDRFGVIFASAARSGNDEPAIARREPLALLAAHNLMRAYPVDPERVYVGGFSGGSRVALRLALGYPDLFHGAMLNAGGDAIGTRELPIPPADLMREFERSMRVVYVTGEHDTEYLNEDLPSQRSLHRWCVANIDSFLEPGVGHEVADATALSRVLKALESAPAVADARIEKCRAGFESELSAMLDEVERHFAKGERDRAMQLLAKLDARFGGLAAPRSVELAARR
jgi:pimeloyl-ACP methyl ester carboxylesterase